MTLDLYPITSEELELRTDFRPFLFRISFLLIYQCYGYARYLPCDWTDGMIIFPATGVFANLGPMGVSMFFISTILAQLVYSLGGSEFHGANGSMMIEVVVSVFLFFLQFSLYIDSWSIVFFCTAYSLSFMSWPPP